jgi:hypothetical protein
MLVNEGGFCTCGGYVCFLSADVPNAVPSKVLEFSWCGCGQHCR